MAACVLFISDRKTSLNSITLLMTGNLWRELWEASKPVPAVKQAPLFDEELAVEGILNAFEKMHTSEFFRQLFVSLIGLGIANAEPMLSSNGDFSKLFYECKEYIVSICQSSKLNEHIDDIVQLYLSQEYTGGIPCRCIKQWKQCY
ncbi:hypothetical protein PIB30_117418 [Stylosanthes scabra]|uniref:Rab3GAP catalytic subunit conserved domain-containing protein n=1 Tax=Stylosanthes scabra TaxID=79078 RepID=A0ABU6SF66_9FABA|nr:hypothetical protein [Stylosanthes scabra]